VARQKDKTKTTREQGGTSKTPPLPGQWLSTPPFHPVNDYYLYIPPEGVFLVKENKFP